MSVLLALVKKFAKNAAVGHDSSMLVMSLSYYKSFSRGNQLRDQVVVRRLPTNQDVTVFTR